MKNIFYSLVFMLIIFFGNSCKDASFLDETVTSDIDFERIFSDSVYTVGYLTEIYVELGFDVHLKRFSDRALPFDTYGGLQGACDEMEFKILPKVTPDVQFATGTVNPVSIYDDAWKIPYENIRRVNIFFQGIKKAPLQEGLKRTYTAEARFLRAWYYATMLRHYGGVPLIGDTVYTVHDNIEMKRNTYKECVDFIISECKIAEEDLPPVTTGRDFGRVTKGACRGLISRVLLYAASPLFSNSTYGNDSKCPKELVGYTDASDNAVRERWKLAAEAAQQVIQSNYYKLYVDSDDKYGGAGAGFAKLFFTDKPEGHVGHILDWRQQKTLTREQLFFPPSFGGNGLGGYPYQELADAFLMKDGKRFGDKTSKYYTEIDDGTGKMIQDPYKDREPRFYHSIITDQRELVNREDIKKVNLHLNADGTPSGQDAIFTGSTTGYYNGKQTDQNRAGNYIHMGEQGIPLIRYAEILLNYAEAQNEYKGPKEGFDFFDEEGNAIVFTPITAIQMIRERAGVEKGDGLYGYGISDNIDKDAMRELIRHERRIELAVEGHRFWDVRRWMIAETTENQQMTGMEIRWLNAGGEKKIYKRFNVRKHVFRPDRAMYLWPLPYKEVTKSTDMIQNPYYN